MRFISFDCAYLHMGVTVVDVQLPDLSTLPELTPTGSLAGDIKLLKRYYDCLDHLYDSLIRIIYAQRLNLVPSGELDIHCAALVLKDKLDTVDREYGPFDAMLYENQMVQNDKSRTISHFLVYHYAGVSHVERVPPTLKNQLVLAPGLAYGDFAARGGGRYDANKAHSLGSFQHWIKYFPCPELPAGKQDDIADSFTQFLGRLRLYCEGRVAKAKTAAKKTRRKPRKADYELE